MKLHILVFLLLAFHYSFAQNTTMKEKMYSIEIIRYNVPADQQENFEKSYAKAGEHLKASPFCLGFEIIRGVEERHKYIVRIHWTSVDDHLQKFRNSEEFRSFFALVRGFYNNIEEMKHYEKVISDDEQR
jgi:heme-degrading monooxygenase HmoA